MLLQRPEPTVAHTLTLNPSVPRAHPLLHTAPETTCHAVTDVHFKLCIEIYHGRNNYKMPALIEVIAFNPHNQEVGVPSIFQRRLGDLHWV